MNNLPEETKSGAIIAGATTAGATIGSCLCPGVGSAVGAGLGAILAGIAVVVKALDDNQ